MEDSPDAEPVLSQTGQQDEWKIKIVLTRSDVAIQNYSIRLDNDVVEEHILKHWSENKIKRATIDDIKIVMEDADTQTEHEVNFRYYDCMHFIQQKHAYVGCYVLQGLWRKSFVDRRLLRAGDEIGIKYIPHSSKLCFCVLRRAGAATKLKK